MLPAGGLEVSPSFKSPPRLGGYRGLIETISAVSHITERGFCVKLVGNVVPIKPRSRLLYERSDLEAL
jgi:hypothetical protein